jgi:hypothetical protein
VCPDVQRHTDSNDRHHARFSGSPAASCSTPSSRGPGKQPADTGGFARCRHLELRTPKSSQTWNSSCGKCRLPARSHAIGIRFANALHHEKRQRGRIPFFWREKTGDGSILARTEVQLDQAETIKRGEPGCRTSPPWLRRFRHQSAGNKEIGRWYRRRGAL